MGVMALWSLAVLGQAAILAGLAAVLFWFVVALYLYLRAVWYHR
jgi:hypothetical protein